VTESRKSKVTSGGVRALRKGKGLMLAKISGAHHPKGV